MEPYYYTHMTKQQQSVYMTMKNGLMALAPSFQVPRLDGRELGDVFFKLRLDCPEIFWAVSFRFRYYPDSANVELIPDYLFEKDKIKEHQTAMEGRVQRLVRQFSEEAESGKGDPFGSRNGSRGGAGGKNGKNGGTGRNSGKTGSGERELILEKLIHDFICTNVHYDKLKKPYSHEIIGPLGHGVGVCEGIAKTVKILCDRLGIWCMIVISEANPEKKIKYRHAWNVVKIGGTCYHLDATFDNTLGHGESLRLDYFNLNDKQIFRDHEPVLYPVPACEDGEHFYYKESHLSFTTLSDVKKRAAQAVKKKQPFLFHWRGGYLTREVLKELLDALKEAAASKAQYARVSLNWPQAVLLVRFADCLPEAEVVMEKADEENEGTGGEMEAHTDQK